MFLRRVFLIVLLFLSLSAEARNVTLKWQIDQSMLAYEVEVAKDIAFEKPVKKLRLNDPEIRLDLPVGTFFYRVRYIDKEGDPLYWSKPGKIDVIPKQLEVSSPIDGATFTHYELNPEIGFQWEAGDDGAQYHFQVENEEKEIVFEKKFDTNINALREFPPGLYFWKVRVIYQKVYKSPFTELRKFEVLHQDLKSPKLVFPGEKNRLKAGRPITFVWQADPNANYNDVLLQRKSGSRPYSKGFRPPKNFEEDQWAVQSLPAGEYQWAVKNKEGKKTPGVRSEPQSFAVYSGTNVPGSLKVEYGISPASFKNSLSTDRTSPSTQVIEKKSTLLQELALYYVPVSGLTFGGELQAALGDEPYGRKHRNYRGWLGWSGGVGMFTNIFKLGYQEYSTVENLPSSIGTENLFSTTGIFLENEFSWEVVPNWIFNMSGSYYKPLSNKEGRNGFVSDMGFFRLKLGYNFWKSLWVNYSFRYTKIVTSFSLADGKSRWTTTKMEPIFVSVAFHY